MVEYIYNIFFERELMRNIKIILKFVGTDFHGWQIQKNCITVQELVTEAVKKMTGENTVSVVGCGRTDSGVHASAYVANFKTNSVIPAERIPYALNTFFPESVVCLSASDSDEDFHAGKSAVNKTYTYSILNSPIRDPFLEPYTYFVKYPLDIDAMKKAAGFFIGTHDFVGFAAVGYSVKTTVRTIYSIEITKSNDIIKIKINGNGFLYNMVRIIAGTLIFVGNGRIKAEEIPGIIESKKRENAGITAPAKGLCLTEVNYE